ncbi:hypothetical protein PR048_008522 [Dryococelus australis]|uniref:Uncharacterized protein n=1 Tax=Dryococelus australis TaxID=614101 RepID=A0ABQ9HZ38_9NEOP|nr:hypothetical protein PR048_008522 [Dryococelus australis]
MVDMEQTVETCIISTLVFVTIMPKGMVTPILLFCKALGIISTGPEPSPLKEAVLRLGGMHTIMIFLGCIGFVMTGNTVKHMLSGKAIARAICGHLIVSSVLHTIIAEKYLCHEEELQQQLNLKQTKEELKTYQTPGLWLQYMKMAEILKKFLKAE